MQLDFSLTLRPEVSSEGMENSKKAGQRKRAAAYMPTWDEMWYGYVKPNGKEVKGILQLKNSAADELKLLEVKHALENGEIQREVHDTPLKRAEALRLYGQVAQLKKQQYLDEMVRNTPANYRLVQTERQLAVLAQDLRNESIFALDTETTGLDVHGDDVMVGLSLSLPRADYHVYIPVGHVTNEPQLSRERVLEVLSPFLRSPFIGKVLHNARFDAHVFRKHGVHLMGIAWDTQVAMAILNENEMSYALKNLATKYGKYFGFKDTSRTYEELFGKVGFQQVPLAPALVYAAKDTHLTWKLYVWQHEHMEKRPELMQLYQEIENPLIEVVIEMEQAGFKVDLDFAQEYAVELRAEIESLEAQLVRFFGEDTNFNSPIQLAEVLYDRLGLPDVSKKRSTDVKTLKKLQSKCEGITHLLRYRELTKLLGTYIEALPSKIKRDGNIHGQFNQVATVTGRFSSNDPNLQNLPPRARNLIIAPDGTVILGSDFSQIEPRVLAHMSGDQGLLDAYRKGLDLYSLMASATFKVDIADCGDGSKYRKMMKVGLLAVMYGITMHALAESLGITVEEAQQFIRDFYAAYPGVYRFIQETHAEVKENEYVSTLHGRKRRFPGHKREAIVYDRLAKKICDLLGVDELPLSVWDYPELPYKLKREFQDVKGNVERVRRMAVNAKIQGTAAEIMKIALIRLHRLCTERGWRVIGTVHDEALLLVPEAITLEEIVEIEQCMTGAASLDVPLRVDTEIMTRWGQGKSKKEWFGLAA